MTAYQLRYLFPLALRQSPPHLREHERVPRKAIKPPNCCRLAIMPVVGLGGEIGVTRPHEMMQLISCHRNTQSTVAEAVALGIEQEGAHCRWAYLQLMTRGRVLDAPGVREMFQDSTVDITPDDRVRILFDTIVAMETPS